MLVQDTATQNPLKINSGVRNSYEDFSDESAYVTNSYEDEDPDRPSDNQVPYSEHEAPEYTGPNYTAPGKWAKPPPEKNIPLEFVPTKSYAQVRASHTIKRVPQEEAVETAETKEEKENAARLREVVTNSKVATVYTEEGFEDASYNHAGQERGADFREGYARKLDNELNRGTRGKGTGSKSSLVRLTSPKPKNAGDKFEDYSEHPHDSMSIEELESRKVNKNIKNILKKELKNPKIIPKLIVEEGIDELERQNKYENTEAEKRSEIYGAEKLTKCRECNDYDEENSSENPKLETSNTFQKPEIAHITHDTSEETTVPVYTVRPRHKFEIFAIKEKKRMKASKKSGDHNIKLKTALANHQNISKMIKRKENFYVKPDLPLINSTKDSSVATLRYMSTEIPTTINYGEIFWKYFKERQNQRATLKPEIFHEKTTVNEDSITISTMNGHAPYPFSTKNHRNVSTSHTFGNQLVPELIDIFKNDPISESTNLQWPNKEVQPKENKESLEKIVSNTFFPDITDSTVKLWTSGYDGYNASRRMEGPEYTSTPEYSVSATAMNNFNFRPKNTKFDHNPFLVHYARSAKGSIPRYNVLIRPHADHTKKSKAKSEANFVKKNVNYIQNQGDFRPIIDNLKTKSTQDFSFLKPPLPPLPTSLPSLFSSRNVAYTDLLPHYSTMTKQIKRLEQRRNRLPDNQVENPVQKLRTKFPKYVDSTVYKQFPLTPQKKEVEKEVILMLHLHPPDPLKKSEYAEYGISNRQSKQFLKPKKTGKHISFQSPVVGKQMHLLRRNSPDVWKQVKSDKNRIKRNISNMKKSETNILKPELKLLNESPKIIDMVINSEIRKRFENTRNQANYSNEKALKNEVENVEIEIPKFKYVNDDNNFVNRFTTARTVIDLEKYPFYENDTVQSSLTLKYIINPERVPKKTFGGMEFYESRNYSGCDEVNPNLENVTPAEEEPAENSGLKTDLPRLQGLGEKLDCFKEKYFDDNPLDNPIFLESQVEQPVLPAELYKTQFSSKIFASRSDNDDDIFLHHSKNLGEIRSQPVKRGLKKRQPNDNWESIREGSIDLNKKIKGIRNNKTLSTQIKKRPSRMQNHMYRERHLYDNTPYESEIYEDVMGNIENVDNMYSKVRYKSFPTTTSRRTSGRESNFYESTPYQTEIYEDIMGNIQNADKIYDKEKYESFSTTTLRTSLPVKRLPTFVDTFEKAAQQLLYPMKHNQNSMKSSRRKRTNTTDQNLNLHATNSDQNNIKYRKKVRNSPKVNSDIDMFHFFVGMLYPGKTNTRGIHLPKNNIQKKFKRSITDSSSKLFSSDGSKVFDKTSLKRRCSKCKKEVTKSASLDEQLNIPSNETKKIVYTINDRIRFSKPKHEYGKHGRFTNESRPSEVNSRRLEPTYNPIIKRRKVSTASHLPLTLPVPVPTPEFQISTTVLPTSSTNLTIILLDENVTLRNPLKNESISEQKTDATFKLDIPIEHKESVHKEITEQSTEDPGEFASTSRYNDETTHEYDVHEDVSENKPREESIDYVPEQKESDLDKDSSESEEHTEIEDDVEKRESDGDDGSSENSGEYGEEVLEPQDEKIDVDESSTKSKDDINDEDQTFDRFDSRPFSPPENFEDEKYADLGPRIHKPAFYHPPFIVPGYEKSHLGRVIDRFDSDQSEESGETKKYVFPWEEDENLSKEEYENLSNEGDENLSKEGENGEETRYSTRIYEDYVYPWEKRDTLAKRGKNAEKQ